MLSQIRRLLSRSGCRPPSFFVGTHVVVLVFAKIVTVCAGCGAAASRFSKAAAVADIAVFTSSALLRRGRRRRQSASAVRVEIIGCSAVHRSRCLCGVSLSLHYPTARSFSVDRHTTISKTATARTVTESWNLCWCLRHWG